MTKDEAVSVIVAKVKLLQPDMASSDEVLDFYSNKMVEEALAYCNREDFPDALIYTAAELICKIIGDNNGKGSQNLKSVQMNDTKFEFNTGTLPAAGCMSDEDFNSIKSKLNRYRKLVFR